MTLYCRFRFPTPSPFVVAVPAHPQVPCEWLVCYCTRHTAGEPIGNGVSRGSLRSIVQLMGDSFSGSGKMADSDRVGFPIAGAVLAVSKENGEPLSKRQRLEDTGGGGSQLVGAESEGKAALPPIAASLQEEGEASSAMESKSRAHNGSGFQGLPLGTYLVQGQEEGGAEEMPNGDLSDQAVDYGAGIHLDDDLAGGFHSCDSEDDDGASHASSSDWAPRPCIGPYTFVQRHLMMGTDPRTILKDLLPDTVAPSELDDMTLWQIVINILSDPPKRKKRKDINTIDDAVKLLQESKKIIVLTGAGVSVSCGIPDFRSRDGIYARLAVDFPDLPNPQAMFDIEYFRKDPRPFFKFAKEIFPGQFQPSLCHRFIAMLDKEEKLLRNYTQNIDTLEQVAGIEKIIQCHGSFAEASCLVCKYKVDCEAVREDIFNQIVPRCPRCSSDEPLAIMKPDIVFFGENLPEQFHRAMKYDKNEVDLLIVIGSSLKVRPVALIPSSIPHEVPQILINREPLPHLHFDIELLGDCDVIINELCQRLDGKYSQLCTNSLKLSQITEKPPRIHKGFLTSPETVPSTDLNTGQSPALQSDLRGTDLQLSASNTMRSLEKPEEASKLSHNCSEENLEVSKEANTQLSNEKDQETAEKDTDIDSAKDLESKYTKEQISKRLDSTQFLFLAPNRYIFHGAEVFSDSDEDLTSSSCGTNSDSESLLSPSLHEPIEEDSDTEECFHAKYENETDTDNRADLEREPERVVLYQSDDLLGIDGTTMNL
ncbi:NAD-dependent protein deacetylase sirtuin-1 isoform X1 [Xenopus tropicalis]|nr:NAD-dependent protein deacetylase sirtuin-1 isoform X1 [Xenopus tropicalis]